MQGKRLSEDLFRGVPKEAKAAVLAPEVLRKHGVAQGTLYRRKAKYGQMEVSEGKRMRSLQMKNRRLKRLVADQALGHPSTQARLLNKMVTPTVTSRVPLGNS